MGSFDREVGRIVWVCVWYFGRAVWGCLCLNSGKDDRLSSTAQARFEAKMVVFVVESSPTGSFAGRDDGNDDGK